MTLPAALASTPVDAERAAELRRVKWLATGVLVATLIIFIAAKALLPLHPAFGFVAAFAAMTFTFHREVVATHHNVL